MADFGLRELDAEQTCQEILVLSSETPILIIVALILTLPFYYSFDYYVEIDTFTGL